MRSLAAIAAIAVVAGSLGCAAPETCTHVGQPVTIAAARPLTLRVEAGVVWVAPNAVSLVSRAWTVPVRGPVDDLVVTALPEGRGYVVSFRQGGMAWQGELDSLRSPRGPLHRMVEPTLPAASEARVAAR